MKKYVIRTKTVEYYLFDSWMTKLEMRAFGWADKGWDGHYTNEYDLTYQENSNTVTASRRYKSYNVFKRIEPYSSNIILKLLEVLMSIFSWIRRKLILLLWVFVAGGIVFGAIEGSNSGDYLMLYMGIGILAFIYLPSMLLALSAWLTRKIFKIDEKLKESLEKNGYVSDIKSQLSE